MSNKYTPSEQCKKQLHVLNEGGEKLKNIDYSAGILKLPEFGTYTIYWTIANFTENESKQVRFTITAPSQQGPIVISYDPDVTKEQISASFSEIDSDKDKNLSLGELLVFYIDLNLKGGLKAGLIRIINQFDKNKDNQINYVEIFGGEKKVEVFVPAAKPPIEKEIT